MKVLKTESDFASWRLCVNIRATLWESDFHAKTLRRKEFRAFRVFRVFGAFRVFRVFRVFRGSH